MKKVFIIFCLFILSIFTTRACEICGCGLGNYYIGLLPQFQHKFIGLRYQYRNFNTLLTNDPTQFSHDFYKTAEIWGGWNISDKLQVIALVPFNFIHQVSDDGITDKNGIGDMAVMANYKVFDKNALTVGKKNLFQQLWVGVGLKLPTGKFSIDITDPLLVTLANTQLGTASTDFMLNVMYNVRVNKAGINTSASFKINTSNKDKYSFGNKFTTSSILYFALHKSKVGITPSIGLQYENAAANTLISHKVELTGGAMSSTAIGLELNINKISFGGNVQSPISQNFGGGVCHEKLSVSESFVIV
jgi:hypothetical protein